MYAYVSVSTRRYTPLYCMTVSVSVSTCGYTPLYCMPLCVCRVCVHIWVHISVLCLSVSTHAYTPLYCIPVNVHVEATSQQSHPCLIF